MMIIFKMLVIMIWLGSVLPEQFYSSIAQCHNYIHNNCILLGEPHWYSYIKKYKSMFNISDERMNQTLLQERVDLLKLLYLYEKGGIYTDINNKIDYRCFYQWASNNQQKMFFGQIDSKPNNYFIYAPKPKDPQILRVLKEIFNCPSCSGSNFAGAQLLSRISVESIDIRKCVTPYKNNSADSQNQNWQDFSIPLTDDIIRQCFDAEEECKNKLNNSLTCLFQRRQFREKIDECHQQSKKINSSLQICTNCLSSGQRIDENTEQKLKISKFKIILFVMIISLTIGGLIGCMASQRKDKQKQVNMQQEQQSEREQMKKEIEI